MTSDEIARLIAVSDGGGHTVDNLQWVHDDVNRMKGTMNQDRFIQIVQLIAQNVGPCHST